MDWFWHALIICVVVIPVTIMWFGIAVEILRRRDLNGWQRVGWLVTIFVLPVLGSVVYLILTWRRAGLKQGDTELPVATPANPSTVDDLTALDRQRRSGALTDAEFETGSRQILEGKGGRHSSEERES
ncbi:MAG TPA: PLDc N-terminal domain-containing protein [Mycobacterium sp.]|jgi:type VI protein secretion system component VasK|nr:PLDc N-terminal domain-containing protein [Mycobacterium sp.]